MKNFGYHRKCTQKADSTKHLIAVKMHQKPYLKNRGKLLDPHTRKGALILAYLLYLPAPRLQLAIRRCVLTLG